MQIQTLFQPSQRLSALSLPLRWSVVTLLVLVAFGLRCLLLGSTLGLSYLIFLPAIILASVLVNHGSGFLATALSALLEAVFFIEPDYSIAVSNTNANVGLTLFAFTGFFIAAVTEALHIAYVEAAEAHREAAAARDRAKADERERNLMLVEFSHRVKNDLQRIVGTMVMRAAKASPETAETLREEAVRVRVLARVHDRLARRDGKTMVDIHEYFGDLAADLRTSLIGLRPIGLFTEIERHMLSVSRAGTMGLVANELLTNALKHAFPEGRSGAVSVKFRCEGPDFLLIVGDDGIGLPEMPSEERQKEIQRQGGMGRQLVRALAAQLGGQVETARRDPTGTLHVLRFPVVHPGDADNS